MPRSRLPPTLPPLPPPWYCVDGPYPKRQNIRLLKPQAAKYCYNLNYLNIVRPNELHRCSEYYYAENNTGLHGGNYWGCERNEDPTKLTCQNSKAKVDKNGTVSTNGTVPVSVICGAPRAADLCGSCDVGVANEATCHCD